MSLRAAKALHLALFLVGVALYVVFVLPRWWVLTGDIPTAVATAGRIVAGIPIALAAMPVLAILRLALSRKAKTPELALRLRAWSAVLHVVAGVLILVTAVVEIWLRLAVGGPYLFAVYGAAAAIAILAVLALYLSFAAEKPPAPPKPPKAAKVKAAKVKAKVQAARVKAARKPGAPRFGKKRAAATGSPADEPAETAETGADPSSSKEDTHSEATVTEATVTEATVTEATVTEATVTEATVTTVRQSGAGEIVADELTEDGAPGPHDEAGAPQPTAAILRNKRPAPKSRHRLRR
jgi:hypothetical protein